jgi:AcrR family transcriptional regulator
VPKLWTASVEEHRRTVQAAILDAAAALVAEHGLAVTMSQIAQQAGISRATLYKYFSDVEAIALAWHERQVTEHLRQLDEAAARAGRPGERLRTVLAVYAELSTTGRRGDGPGHGMEPAVPIHHAEHMHRARHRLIDLLTEVIRAAAEAGEARTDVPPAELAVYCMHALAAAAALPTRAARQRLIDVTLAGLHP